MSFARFGTDLAIDLGTANTCVFARGRGVVVSEPSLIAFNAVTGAVEAVGDLARGMLGRTPGHLRPVRPIRDGVIVRIKLYKDRTEALEAAGLSE